MSTIQPPWPIPPWQDPMTYDQRGACWPRGPCFPSDKLQLRYDVIGSREGGAPVGALWGGLAVGMLFVVLPQICSPLHYYAFSGINPPPIPPSALEIWQDETNTEWNVKIEWWWDVLFPVVWQLTAQTFATQSFCGASDIVLPVTGFFGPPDAPDFISVKGVPWWGTSSYEWGNP